MSFALCLFHCYSNYRNCSGDCCNTDFWRESSDFAEPMRVAVISVSLDKRRNKKTSQKRGGMQ